MRASTTVTERVETLLSSHPLHDFRTADNRAQLSQLLNGVTAGAVR